MSIDSAHTSLSKTITYLALLLTGAGIGWLAGLSVSPVISVIITSITGAAAALVAALAGLDAKPDPAEGEMPLRKLPANISPYPLAALIAGIVVGSIFGVRARNHHWLGSEISSEIAKWTQRMQDGRSRQRSTARGSLPWMRATPTHPLCKPNWPFGLAWAFLRKRLSGICLNRDFRRSEQR
jgi:hypothetical protein